MNHTIMQYFEWYLPDDGKHWENVKNDAPHLKDIGITKLWLPPASKATGTNDVGYGPYDLYDLGEFDQKGAVRTKYGTKDEYIDAINALQENGIMPIADIVLNHKAQGDEKETFSVLKMDPENRQKPISEAYEIEGYTHFYFPGRQGKYSDFEWHWYHFSGLDYDARNDETGIYQIQGEGKGWADNEEVDREKGNFDYLMFNDIDYSHPEVVEETRAWIKWFIETTGIKGLRLDAIKHIDRGFVEAIIHKIYEEVGEEFYVFGEYWNADYETKADYLEDIDYSFDLFDVKLHMNFYEAALQNENYDLTKILDKTLIDDQAWSAVTFVDNHDTQAGQSLESEVGAWFKPLAYGLILLLQNGLPTVFYGDYYGTKGENGHEGYQEILDKLLYLRKNYAYGDETRYFDHSNCIGWIRYGNEEYPDGLVALISNGTEDGFKDMSLGEFYAGKTFVDYLGHYEGEVTLDEAGNGRFMVHEKSISVWVVKDSLI